MSKQPNVWRKNVTFLYVNDGSIWESLRQMGYPSPLCTYQNRTELVALLSMNCVILGGGGCSITAHVSFNARYGTEGQLVLKSGVNMEPVFTQDTIVMQTNVGDISTLDGHARMCRALTQFHLDWFAGKYDGGTTTL